MLPKMYKELCSPQAPVYNYYQPEDKNKSETDFWKSTTKATQNTPMPKGNLQLTTNPIN